MGGGEEAPLYPTEAFVLKNSKIHYQIPVRSLHWQLRSLISVEKNNTVYFPGGHDNNYILKLDTESHSIETVRVLSFSLRCLVAKNGWVCCGGETGEFTAVRLEPRQDAGDVDMQLDLDPDSRLPLDFDSASNDVMSLVSRAMNRSKTVMAKSMKLVRDRVNCITLWFPPTDGARWEGAETEPLAVLANNDNTVALVSLRDFDENDKIEPLHIVRYPDFVNRAVISPDGRLLIAILDDPYLYVHERVEEHGTTPSILGAKQYKWEPRSKYMLKSQRKEDSSQNRGSFAACFSSSGAYLAVGTQYGIISIFDTAALTDASKNPIITTFPSSRPEDIAGAIRDMAFCPGPYDLLAWTEDRGRVGIADVRSGFVYRQIIDIGDKEGQQATVLDGNSIDPRLLGRRADFGDPLGSSFSSYLLGSTSERRRGGEARARHDLSPLSPEETMILEALQDGRRRREQRDAQRTGGETGTRTAEEQPRALASGNRLAAWGERATRRSTLGNDPESRMVADASASLTRAIDALLGDVPDRAGRDQERGVNTSQRPGQSSGGGLPIPRSTGTTREDRGERGSSRFDDLEALYSMASGQAGRETGRRDRQSFVSFLSGRPWDEMAQRRSNLPDLGVHQAPPQPDNTSGLSWNHDGRILFVGAQNGIYEYRLDVCSRKFHPSISLR